MAETYYFNTVREVWDKLIESEPLFSQIDVYSLCDAAQTQHRENLMTVLMLAYEAGRKHDLMTYTALECRIREGDFKLKTL